MDAVVPQELFDENPSDILVATVIYISLRKEFIHLAEIAEKSPLCCGLHEDCDPKSALKGLLFGYQVKNIIGFIAQ